MIQGLILDESGVAASLEKAEEENGRFEVSCSLDNLENLINCIAAEANHAKTRKREEELDALYDRLVRIQQEQKDAL